MRMLYVGPPMSAGQRLSRRPCHRRRRVLSRCARLRDLLQRAPSQADARRRSEPGHPGRPAEHAARGIRFGQCPEDGVYVDVGANNGFFYALQVARRPRARTFASEPDPQILPHLEHNVRRNGLAGQIDVLPTAISDAVGRSRLTVGRGASGFFLARMVRGQALRSQSPTLDTFAEERGLERIDLIKVDIEGREELMPRGAQNTLLELRPIVLLELIDDHLRRSGSSRAGVERLLKAPGYSVHVVSRFERCGGAPAWARIRGRS